MSESEGAYEREQALMESVGQEVEEEFKWRSQDGVEHSVSSMETKHLFHTLKMIWNHCAPPHMQLKPFKRYKFGSTYTSKYMLEAVRVLSKELRKRKDLSPNFTNHLAYISYCARALSPADLDNRKRKELKG